MTRIYTAIGLMSGTSMDGIDAALIETDGQNHVRPLDFLTIPYDDDTRNTIRAVFGQRDRHTPAVLAAEALSTQKHTDAVRALLDQAGRVAADIDLIGYHGQTIFHAPKDGLTIQIGDGPAMSAATGIPVVYDMRSNDVAQGGEGAPLAPLYHQARARSANLAFPTAILNIGGVANVTYIGEKTDDILAFDTGPGNALLDDWMQKRMKTRFDKDGQLARSGIVIPSFLKTWFDHPYFTRKPPKSLDRNEWDIADLGKMPDSMNAVSDADGAATILAFTGQSIVKSLDYLPAAPRGWYICGGGRHNTALMEYLSAHLPGVQSVDILGWDGDATEAECFAYLGVRSKLGLPLSLPTTTGVAKPTTGGKLA